MTQQMPAVGAEPATPYPRKLTIEFTDRCNLKCFICTREEFEGRLGGKGENLDLKELEQLAPALAAAETIQISGFGEVFLHPQMGDALDYIYSLNPRDNLIYIISNGTLLSREWGEKLGNRLNYLAVSLNAANPESYRRDMHPYVYRYTKETAPEAYTGRGFAGSKRGPRAQEFEQTVARIQAFMAGLPAEARGRVGLHFLAHRDNIDEMTAFVRLADDIGVRVVELNPYMVNRRENLEYSVYFEQDRYNAAIDEARQVASDLGVRLAARKFGEEAARTFMPERDCRWPFDEALVSRFGSVVPCCHNGRGKMGNAFEQGFDRVWHGFEYQKLRTERWHDACQRCNPLQTFDDWRTHFHPVVKIDNEFNSKHAAFAASQASSRPEVLIVGAGRDGTRSLGRLVQDLYAANGRRVDVRHFGESFRLYDGALDYATTGDPRRMAEVARDWTSEVMDGNGFAFALPAIRDVLGPDIKIIHVKRARAACIESLAREAVLHPLYWGGYVEAYSDDGREVPAIRPTAPLYREMSDEEWRTLSLEDRLGWYYDKTHALIDADADRVGAALAVATESLNDADTIARVARFLDPSFSAVCEPVHVNGSYPVDTAGLDDGERYAVTQMLGALDKRRMAGEASYPIQVFVGQFMEHVSRVSDKGKALELNIVLGEIKKQAEAAQNGKLLRQGDHVSGDIFDELFAGLDGRQIATSPIYPLLHFIGRLPATSLGRRYSDADLAGLYRHLFDGLATAANRAGVPIVV